MGSNPTRSAKGIGSAFRCFLFLCFRYCGIRSPAPSVLWTNQTVRGRVLSKGARTQCEAQVRDTSFAKRIPPAHLFAFASVGFEAPRRPSCGRIRRCGAGFCQKVRERSAKHKFEIHLLQNESHPLRQQRNLFCLPKAREVFFVDISFQYAIILMLLYYGGGFMDRKHLTHGIVAVSSPIPLLSFTCLWSWIAWFGFGMGILKYETIPEWLLGVSLIPLLISPIICCVFLVLGIIHRREQHARLCIILSVIGLLENAALLYGLIYLGSRY